MILSCGGDKDLTQQMEAKICIQLLEEECLEMESGSLNLGISPTAKLPHLASHVLPVALSTLRESEPLDTANFILLTPCLSSSKITPLIRKSLSP